jgi:hypothetical protein
MKKILPVLLCYVLSASQMYAVSGGPVFTSGISPVGTFSGVIEGITETDDLIGSGPTIPGDPLPPANNSNTVPSNALGLFDLSVPAVGNASGAFVLFADGIVFTGTIQAFANPNNDKLTGILEATSTVTITDVVGTATTTTVTETAIGLINAKITGATSSSTSLGSLTGTANLDVSYGEYNTSTLQPIIDKSLTFNVIGVKQSGTATTTTTTTG